MPSAKMAPQSPQVIAVVLGMLFTFTLQQVSGQISNTTCGAYPAPPEGSTQQCYPTSCIATCVDPLRFPNGAKSLVISCRNNAWIPTNGGFTSIPNCQVQCSPACENGQKCFYPFVECHCPDGFGGQKCKDAVTCPVNEFHRGCADSCKTTCRARDAKETCSGRCEEGCVCSASMARDDRGNCVPLEKCPCYFNDVEIEDGRVEVVKNGDQYDICKCSRQQWTCKQLTKGYAAIFGVTDNFAMLDGTLAKYPEFCGAYYLLKDQEFSLILEMNTMGFPSRTLTINIHDMVVRLLKDKKFVVNAETINTLPFQQSDFKVWHASSKYILAQLPNGIEIQWDGTTIANIFIPPTLYGKMQGLFGQYNVTNNGLYLTYDGEYTNSSSDFMESWRVDHIYQCIVPRTTQSSTNCTLQSIPSNIETFCNKIYGPAFTDCNKLIDNATTLSYYEVCVLEACACDSISCSCPVLSNYASQCKNHHGLNMGNMVFPECVTTCPEGQSYQYCRSSCLTSCSSKAMHPQCTTECVEGCNCPEGQSLDKSGKCINSTLCSCFYNGIAYNNNANMVRPSGKVDAEICTCKESTWVCEKQSWVTCSSWGDPAYRTFDGQFFLFQGRSSYTLVQHSEFIIEATNKKQGQGSVTESLTIRINGMKIELLQNSKLRFDGKTIKKLPWEKVGVIKVYKTSHAHSVAVELHNRVKIDWDGKTRFTISLPGILYGTVKGLCGTFNGNDTDDFEMPSGDLALTWDDFGNSWKVDPNLPPEISNPHPCDNDETLAKRAEEYCSSIRRGEFKRCHSHLNPDTFYESCRFDVCVLENSTSVCPHFTSYDYECRKKNIILDWTHEVVQCNVTCSAGLEYKLCGNLCTRSCRDISSNKECNSTCVEGCYCPNGKTLDDNGKCVALTSCNCYYNGIKYQNGKEITQLDFNGDPKRCKCDKGNWACSPIPDATCQGFGDPHYITFDGARYDFQGSCKYYLLWNNQFVVVGENRPCSVGSHVTCTKSITVKIMGGIEIQLLQGKKVMLNGTAVTTLPVVENNFEIRMHSGYWVEVLLWNGVKINYNGFHEFSITVPGTFYGKTEGLCGTYNGNKDDEYRTIYGNYVNKSSINEFGDSWKTESCNGTDNYEHPCELNPNVNTQKCNVLNGNVFKDCHSVVPVNTFFESCKYDLCAGGGSEELCAAMMVYASECASQGIIIDWRKHVSECKISCPSGQVYEACGNPCTQSCSDITREQKCIGPCVEGCRCRSGSVLDSNNKCVQPFQCSCEYQGKHYKNEDKIIKSGKNKQQCTETDGDSKEDSSEESSEESSESNDDGGKGVCSGDDKHDYEIELCTCLSGKWSCKKQEGAQCSVAEDKHFKTFDKKKYDFVGKCGYVLLQTTNTSIETALQRCSETRKKDSCTRGIVIKHNNLIISLSSPDEIRFNGLKINRYPYESNGVNIRKSGSKYFVTLSDGIEIQWDGPKKTYINVPGRFFASTKGLCGNFNNIKDDDLQINGTIISNVYDFVNSWKVDENCSVVIPPAPPCEANSTIKGIAENHCNAIFNNEFSECHGAVNVEPFYSSCVDDVCSCDGEIECRCTMLEMYADECSEMGIYVNWRQRNQCGGNCPAGQEFQVCGDSCSMTCRDIQLNSNCKSKCVEGCRCPRGKILSNNGICISSESCPCLYNDREYSQGDTIVKQQGDTSEVCQCGEGKWTCRHQSNGICSATNNKYISTFNGIKFSVSNLCSYYLMKIPGFSVVSTSGNCSHQQEILCLADIKLEYENTIIKLYQNYAVVFNNERINQLPFINENITIRMISSVFVVVEFPNGINVFWDGALRARITVPPSFYGKTEGLCGSFSDDETELITHWGTATEDITEFAESWQVNEVCRPEEEIENYCVNDTLRQYAESQCQPLLNIIGFACSEILDALPHYEHCIESVCTNETLEDGVCYLYSVYADECAAKGIIIDWRTRIPMCTYQCRNQEVYERCSSSEFRTCRDLSLPTNDINTCFEGCNCPHGFLLDDYQQCVPAAECSCYSDGKSYGAGESITKTTNNKVENCICIRGKWKCTELSGGRCSHIGFSHFITFDGSPFNFLSNCKFYLVRTEHFTVETEIKSCKENEVLGQPGSSCKKSTTIRIGNLVIDLKQNNEIFINSEKVTALPVTIQDVQIRNANLYTLVVTLPSGAEILMNIESTVYIDVPATYIGATEGLCGFFNHDKIDDMMTSWGQVNNSLEVFVNSWLVDPKCKDCPTEVKSCDDSEFKEIAEEMCSVLNKTLFKPCHSLVNFEASYTICTLELCSSNMDLSYGCVAVKDYALQCANHGIFIDWTEIVSVCVPDCPAGQVYQTCSDSCATSCRDISSNLNCNSKCVDGCGCPDGQVFDAFGKCVQTSNCTCNYRDRNYNTGSKILRNVQGVEPLSVEICICDGGQWTCKAATPEDLENVGEECLE